MIWIDFLKDIIFIILLSLIPAALSYFLDYALGFPGKKDDEGGPNPHAIFAGWIRRLAKNRLDNIAVNINSSRATQFTHLLHGFTSQFNNDDYMIRRLAKIQFKKELVVKAREFISWEWGAGFCVFCTNVWICFLYSLGVIIFFSPVLLTIPVYFLPFIIAIFSHLILRNLKY